MCFQKPLSYNLSTFTGTQEPLSPWTLSFQTSELTNPIDSDKYSQRTLRAALQKARMKEERSMEEKELEKMTATELRDLALKEHPDITGVHAMKKEEILAAIHKARGEAVKETEKEKAEGKVQIDKK